MLLKMEARFRPMLPKFLKYKRRTRNANNRSLNLRRVLAQNTDEFCKNTTLHGLKYIASEELYPTERIFFAISFVAVMLLAGFFILKIYAKWSTTPVILGINPEPTFINEEPFPAVTICNLNQVLKSKAESYSIYSTEFAMLQLLCKRAVNNTIASSITDWSRLGDFIVNVNDSRTPHGNVLRQPTCSVLTSIKSFLIAKTKWVISQPCNRMIVSCRFGAIEYECNELFYDIVTDEGLCCVFNMLHPKFMYTSKIYGLMDNYTSSKFTPVDWYAEAGYPPNLPSNFTPFVAAGTGESLGFSIVLNVEVDEYYCSSSNSAGFKIALHSPNESPNVRETGLLLAHGKETKVRIQAEQIKTDRHLRSIDKQYRHCLFHNERKLLYFTHYTQRNCEMECVAREMIKHCGCISFFMPKIYKNVTICSIHEVSCVEKVRLKTEPSVENCYDTCLPSCSDLTFLPDFFSTPISHNGFEIANDKVENFSHKYVENNIAVVHMYFKENTYRSKIQTEFIGISDFLSSVGGLMGLFLGFSFISIVEFFYYAFIRPCNAFGQRKATKPKSTRSRAKSSLKMLDNQPEMSVKRLWKKRYNNQLYNIYSSMQNPKLSAGDKDELHYYSRPYINSEVLRSISESIDNQETENIYNKPQSRKPSNTVF